jgi:hypothetical protein
MAKLGNSNIHDEVLSGYELSPMVEQWANPRLQNVGLLTAQPFDPADSPRELHHTQLLGKQQISVIFISTFPFIKCKNILEARVKSYNVHTKKAIQTAYKCKQWALQLYSTVYATHF